MFRRAALAVFALLAFAGAAHSAAAPAKAVGQYVDLQPVGLPIVVQGSLVNYVFVYVRVNLTPQADAARWRQQEPFFRDTLVRDGHRAPFVLPNDYQKVDTAKLSAVLMRDVAAITGPGVVRSIEVISQTPSHKVPQPRPRAPAQP